jgi:hypothetical protein
MSGQSDWRLFEPIDQNFSVNCPGGLMEYTSKSFITGIGEMTNQAYFLNMKGDHPNFLYLINIVEYPEQSFPKDSIRLIEELLSTTAEAMSESTGCQIMYQQTEMNDEVPFLILRLHDKESNTSIKSKVFVIHDRLYTLQVYTSHENKLNDFVDKFIKSFRVL